ncbi:MAG: hypothetical protein AB7T22_03425 [Calditrichaceae bacterium]
MLDFLKEEQGASLMELIVIIVVMGVILPSVFLIYSSGSVFHSRYEIRIRCNQLANMRTEEILAYKYEHPDWYKIIDSYAGTVQTADDYTVKTEISYISGWGNAGLDAYEIKITVSHQHLPDGAVLTTRLTKYV